MDLCSRRSLGWSTRKDRSTELPNAALALALQTRGSAQVDLRLPATVAARITAASSENH